MPTRDEKRRQEFSEEKKKPGSTAVSGTVNTAASAGNVFEMMSIPDGGKGNKEALDKINKSRN